MTSQLSVRSYVLSLHGASRTRRLARCVNNGLGVVSFHREPILGRTRKTIAENLINPPPSETESTMDNYFQIFTKESRKKKVFFKEVPLRMGG